MKMSMKMPMTVTTALILATLGVVEGAGPGVAELSAQGVDVYVVYTGRARAEKDDLMSRLAPGIASKAYNADLLGVADYTGRQKALSQLQTARLIVVLGERSADLLGEATMGVPLIIVGSAATDLRSEAQRLYVITDTSRTPELRRELRLVRARGPSDLADAAALRSADAVWVDLAALEPGTAVARAIEVMLGA